MHINIKSYNSSELFVERDISSGKYPFIPSLRTSLMFCIGVIALVLWVTLGTSMANDPYVMKIYPDGTKVILRWSEVGKTLDDGSTHGGAPKIVAYDPAKDGVVPIGEPIQKPQPATTSSPPPSNPIAIPEQPTKVESGTTSSKNNDENYGPMEGFGFRTDVGVAFQQSLSGRESGNYFTSTFQPGIRFDIEPFYNVTDWFGIGVETAFVHNTVHSISIDQYNFYTGSSEFGNGDLYQVPILLNTRFQFPSDGPLRGFVGGGIGGNWNYLNLGIGGEDSQTSFQWNYAFELSAGLCYTITPGLDLNASFKTLCTPNPLLEGQNGQMKSSYNYAAEVGVAWRF